MCKMFGWERMDEIESWLSRPGVLFVSSLVLMWLVSQGGAFLGRRRPIKEQERADFGVIETATLTLLGLIIGFSFSMATSRYDQRKNYEEEEANAIGTEYVRADLLPAAEASRVRKLLRDYLDQRLLHYETRDEIQLHRIDLETARLQNEMWSVVQGVAAAKPTPIIALAVSGMNDVLNSQGYTQAAWRNRIPAAAWVLMIAIAVFGNLMVGYGVHTTKFTTRLLLVLPLVLAVAFLLIADIDSPRRGFIKVAPRNLITLSESMPRQ